MVSLLFTGYVFIRNIIPIRPVPQVKPIRLFPKKYYQRNMASGLAYIDLPETFGPFELLRNWMKEFKDHTTTNFVVFNLATSSNNGDVKSRHVVLQELTEDGLIFVSSLNSPKAKQIAENPKVAACFLFQYSKEGFHGISRQVRIEGIIEELPKEVSERLYNSQPTFAKIRSSLIKEQGLEVKWDELKTKHDELLEKVSNGEIELNVPDYFVAYKIVPKLFDFYHSIAQEIADRLRFTECDPGTWNRCHITA